MEIPANGPDAASENFAAPRGGERLPPTTLPGRLSDYAFFLDIDGTLIRFAVLPGRAYADPWLIEFLEALHAAAGGAVALVSGRTMASIDHLFSPLHIAAAGQHGAERRDAAGVVHRHAPDAARVETVRSCVTAWAADVAGIVVEDKGICVAAHYRLAPEREAEVRHALERCREQAGGAYQLQPGKMVFELRPTGLDKGVAIREFMAEPPFAGRIPLFAGDDDTDEHGFAAVNALGGRTLKVGDGETLAGWRVPDVAAARAWLASLIGQVSPDFGWSSGQPPVHQHL